MKRTLILIAIVAVAAIAFCIPNQQKATLSTSLTIPPERKESRTESKQVDEESPTHDVLVVAEEETASANDVNASGIETHPLPEADGNPETVAAVYYNPLYTDSQKLEYIRTSLEISRDAFRVRSGLSQQQANKAWLSFWLGFAYGMDLANEQQMYSGRVPIW